MKKLATFLVIITGGILIFGLSDFPAFGDANSTANTDKVQGYYLEKAFYKNRTPNLVTTVLADYRGYDTMFETAVIFVAGLAILSIVSIRRKKAPKSIVDEVDEMIKHDPIVRQSAKILIPIIQIFALYVLAHGHYSPGGGFQAGVIFGASFILFSISFSLKSAFKRISHKKVMLLAVAGVLIYAGIGVLCMILSGNFLQYDTMHVLPIFKDAEEARYWAMFYVEVGVMFTVTTIMFAIYYCLGSAGKLEDAL